MRTPLNIDRWTYRTFCQLFPIKDYTTKSYDNPPAYPGYPPTAPGSANYHPMPQPSAPVITPISTTYYSSQQTYGMQQHQPNVQHVSVITSQPVASSTVVVQSVNAFGSHPHAARCLHCQRNITTSVRYESSCKTHFFAVCLFVMGCSCGCCLIPYCVDGCKGAIHTCKLALRLFERSIVMTGITTFSRSKLRNNTRNFWFLVTQSIKDLNFTLTDFTEIYCCNEFDLMWS